MTKLKVPLLSLGAVGRLTKAITFRKHGTQTVAEKLPIPQDAKSPAQLSWRHMFQKVIGLWHALSAAEKQEWESLARPKHMTGYAYFLSQSLRPNPGIYLPLQGGTMSGDIVMAKHRLLQLPLPADSQEPLTLAYFAANIAPYLYNEGARVYHSLAQSIPNLTTVYLAFNGERYDTDTIHNAVTNNSRLTCQTAGKYIISATISYASNPTGLRRLSIYLNRASSIAHVTLDACSADATRLVASTIYHLGVGDYAEISTLHNAGIAIDIQRGLNFSPEFMMQRIGA